jgi:hypothetical protein
VVENVGRLCKELGKATRESSGVQWLVTSGESISASSLTSVMPRVRQGFRTSPSLRPQVLSDLGEAHVACKDHAGTDAVNLGVIQAPEP